MLFKKSILRNKLPVFCGVDPRIIRAWRIRFIRLADKTIVKVLDI